MVRFGEWLPDRPMTEGSLSYAFNVIPQDDHYTIFKFPAAVTTTAISGVTLGAYASRLVAGNSKTYAGNTTALYERNGAGWTAVTRSVGGAYSLTSGTHRWEFTQWESDIYATSLDNVLQRQAGGSGTFENVTGGPWAACIGNVREWLVVGDVDESGTLTPHRVRWCAIGDPTDWVASAATQSGSQDLDAKDGRVMAIRGGEFGIVFQQNAITRMQYIGAPIVWQFDKIDSKYGCDAARSVVQVGRSVYFLAEDGFRVTDGSGESVSISNGKISRWFNDNLQVANKHLITGAYDPSRRIIMWSFPSTTATTGTNNYTVVYHIDSKRWTYAGVAGDILFNGATASVTVEGLDSYSTSLDALTESLDSNFWIGGQPYFMCMNSGYLCTFTDVSGAIGGGVGFLTTSEFEMNPGRRTFISGVEPLSNVEGSVYIVHRNSLSDTASSTPVVTQHARTRIASFRHSSRYQSLKFTFPGIFKAYGFNLFAKPDGVQ